MEVEETSTAQVYTPRDDIDSMVEDEPASPRNGSIRAEDTASDTNLEAEAETLLSSHSHEETKSTQDIEKIPGMIKERLASGNVQFLVWTAINTLATIGIVSPKRYLRPVTHNKQVFTNKQIFKDPHLRRNQSTFAAFHFAITGMTLYYASQRALFERRKAGLVPMLPLGIAMCTNVILPNLSLAYSSVTFYQIARVLLTPTVAVIHFVVYGARIPRSAVYCLIPICLGVAVVSYYDTKPRQGIRVKSAETTPAGVIFALGGVVASSLYTVWIETYRKKFDMNSMQLLFNQAPISAFLLLYAIPFTDQIPDWTSVTLSKWVLIMIVRSSSKYVAQWLILSRAE